jgi:cob(I)alamin adenosyltransferase
MQEDKGLLIVYTGPGKGKTTCALGTAFRAVGQGLRALMVQFIKGSWHYGELDSAKMLGDDKFEIRPMGRGFVKVGGAETDPEDIKMAHDCWAAGRDCGPGHGDARGETPVHQRLSGPAWYRLLALGLRPPW